MPFAVKLTEWYTYICILSTEQTNARDEKLEAEAIKGGLASQKAKDAGHSFGNLSSEMKKLSGRCGMSRFVSDATNLLCPYRSCARV